MGSIPRAPPSSLPRRQTGSGISQDEIGQNSMQNSASGGHLWGRGEEAWGEGIARRWGSCIGTWLRLMEVEVSDPLQTRRSCVAVEVGDGKLGRDLQDFLVQAPGLPRRTTSAARLAPHAATVE